MPSISPLIIRLFDDPPARRRHVKRDSDPERSRRFESKGRVARRRSR